MMLEKKIAQGGVIQCPICGNRFKWTYKLELLHNPELERRNRVSTVFESTPHKYMTHIVTADNNVKFVIGCQRCGTNIETSCMKLMDEENYENNKV